MIQNDGRYRLCWVNLGTNPNGDPEIAYGNPVLAEMEKQNYTDESEDVTESDVEIKDVVLGEHNAK